MDSACCLPSRLSKHSEDRSISRIGPRQLHVVGELIGRNTLQNELTGICVLALIALQWHVQQTPADRSNENHDGQQDDKMPAKETSQRRSFIYFRRRI